MTRYVHGVLRHRTVVLLAIAGLTLLLATRIGRLEVQFDLHDLLPHSHPFVQAQTRLEQLFGGQNLVVIGVVLENGTVFTPAVVTHVRRLTDAVARLPGVGNVLSLTAPRVRAIEGDADGIVVTPVIDGDLSTEGLRAAEERMRRSPLYLDTIMSRDGRATAIAFEIDYTAEVPDPTALRARLDAIIAAGAPPGVRHLLGGQPILAAALTRHSEAVLGYFGLAVIVIGLIHFEAFRTIQGLLLPLVTALLSVVWGLGLMGLVGIPLDPINVATPILIFAVAAGHAVQILKRYYEEYALLGDNHQAIVRATSRVGVVMITAGTVAALAFFSLVTFDTAAVRYFGLFTGIGILSAVVLEMTFIPALRSFLPPPPRRVVLRPGLVDRALSRYLRWVAEVAAGSHARAVLAASAVLALGFAAAALAVQADNASRTYFRQDDPALMDDHMLNRLFAGTHTLDFLIEDSGSSGVLDPPVVKAMARLGNEIESFSDVGKAVSVADLVKTLNVALNPDAAQAAAVPDSAPLIGQLLFLYALSDDEGLSALVRPDHRQARIEVFARDDSTQHTAALIAWARRFIAEQFPPTASVAVAGSLAINYAWNEVMVRGKILNIVQITLLVMVAAAIVFRSLVAGLFVGSPLVLSVLAVFATMTATGVKLDIGTATIAAMAVGLGADYSIYLLYRLREERRVHARLDVALARALDTSGRAVAYVTSAIAGGYLTLCLTGSVMHVRAGALVTLAIVVAGVATTLTLPAMVTVLQPRFLEPRHAGI